VSGQSKAQRSALLPFRDSLSLTDDAAQLRKIRDRTLAAVRARRGEPELLLRHGFATMRLAAVTEDPAYYLDAGDAFLRVTELEPDWPLSWYGLGFAGLGEHETSSSLLTGLQTMLGMQPLLEPARHLVQSAMVDPDFEAGLVDVALLALHRRDKAPIDLALASLRMAATMPTAQRAEVALAHARVEREFGSIDTALVILEASTQEHPRHVMLLRELAITRFVMGRLDGTIPWYRGLEFADPAQLAVYIRDLRYVTPDSVLKALGAVEAPLRGDVMRAYWQHEDPDQLPTDPEQLREHYIRLDFARHQYLSQSDSVSQGPIRLDPLDRGEFDDRGIIYLRHGKPDTRTALGRPGSTGLTTTLGRNDKPEVESTLRIIGMPDNETWHYTSPDGSPITFHFVRRADDADFRSVESALDIIRASRQYAMFRSREEPGDRTDTLVLKTWGGELVSLVAQEVLLSRQEGNPFYAQMINAGKQGAAQLQAEERKVGRESLALPRTYSLKYELPMDAHVDVLAAGAGGGSGVQVAIAIPGRHLSPIRTTRGMVYSIRLRASFVNAASGTATVLDTVRAFVMPRRLNPDQHLLARFAVVLPPGSYQARVAVESEGRGMVSLRETVDVPGLGTGVLAVTDPALGRRSVPLAWSGSGADSVWANPLHTFPASEPMQLYFEVAGLVADTEYTAELAVISAPGADRLRELGRPAACVGQNSLIRLKFDQRHGGGIDRLQREISLDRLRPGDYALMVTVRSTTGEEAIRCREFTVIRQ
jgi:GWxTD domain-containing protein